VQQNIRRRDGGSSDRVYAAVLGHMARNGMAGPGETLVVAVSGGVDSMCLLDLLVRAAAGQRLALVVAHVHHGLRGEEAERDLRLVESRARAYGLPFEFLRVPPASYRAGENVHARARELRYGFLERTAEKWGARKIVTGHHRDDHVETLLMQLFRGSGTLRGIPAVRDGRYLRPLLAVGRQDLVRYAAARGVPHREDASNRDPAFLRTRVRQDLLPRIRDLVNPSVEGALTRFSQILREESDYLDLLARDALRRCVRPGPRPGELAVSRRGLSSQHPALRRRVLRLAFARVTGSTRGLGYAQVQAVSRSLDDASARAQRRFRLHGGVHLFVEPEEVVLSREDLWSCRPYRYVLRVGELLRVPEAGVALLARTVLCGKGRPDPCGGGGEALLAWEEGGGDLAVRNARPGDWFRPLGMGGKKKLKEFFIDRRIPRSRRVRVPLVEVGGAIAWVAGEQVDERFRPTGGERRCLHVQVMGLEKGDGSVQDT